MCEVYQRSRTGCRLGRKDVYDAPISTAIAFTRGYYLGDCHWGADRVGDVFSLAA
jgi:hypothetical protein